LCGNIVEDMAFALNSNNLHCKLLILLVLGSSLIYYFCRSLVRLCNVV
jgi:hypothetical protein